MKKIIRTRIITRTRRQLIVCHENYAAAGAENSENAPIECPHCGELILPPPASKPRELTDGATGERD